MGSCLSAGSKEAITGSSVSPVLGAIKQKDSDNVFEQQNQGEATVHRIPGRMFLNGSSEVASLHTQQGKKGMNQDAMIVWENFGSRTDTFFCGVFDGHGPYGHLVAKRVRDSLPLKLTAHWEANEDISEELGCKTEAVNNEDSTLEISWKEDSSPLTQPEISEKLKESFLKAFQIMDGELKIQPSIDCFCSGTTAVALVKQGRDLVIGNVGDSRAVLGTRDEDNSLQAVQLTIDLKPDIPGEAERILKCKGRVFAHQDEPEVARVWLPNNDSPGLAMARSFGDFCLKDFGLISVPEISYRFLSDKDEFIVLATDGIWDVLSNKEVVDIVASAPARCAARSLVESATEAWRCKLPSSNIDDCAVVCLFLDSNLNVMASETNIKYKEVKSAIQAETATVDDVSGEDLEW